MVTVNVLIARTGEVLIANARELAERPKLDADNVHFGVFRGTTHRLPEFFSRLDPNPVLRSFRITESSV